MMYNEDFKTAYLRFHPGSWPINHHVKHSDSNLVRFHVLPDSREQALDQEEFRHLIARYNTMAVEILGSEKPCWMVLAEPTDPTGHPDYKPEPDDMDIWDISVEDPEAWSRVQRKERARSRFREYLRNKFQLSHVWNFYDPDSESVYKIFAAKTVWNTGQFDRLLRLIHRDRLFNPFWMNDDTGAVFAPYHSGMDVTQPTADALMRLICKYVDWLPVNGWSDFNIAPSERFDISQWPDIHEALCRSLSKRHDWPLLRETYRL